MEEFPAIRCVTAKMRKIIIRQWFATLVLKAPWSAYFISNAPNTQQLINKWCLTWIKVGVLKQIESTYLCWSGRCWPGRCFVLARAVLWLWRKEFMWIGLNNCHSRNNVIIYKWWKKLLLWKTTKKRFYSFFCHYLTWKQNCKCADFNF